MPRQDVPYGGAICRLKERIAEIWDELGKKLHSINGVEGDGAGDVKIVSGDAAIVVTSDQVNHQIEVALDSSQLPAASVSSVNGQTGAVVLDAGDIPSNGNSDVQSDIGALQTMDGALQGNINAEALARQHADSALQTNINAVSASLPAAAAAAVAADPTVAQLVTDLAGKVDLSDVSTVETPDTIAKRNGSGRLVAADPASGATDKSLVTTNWVSQTGDNGPNNLIHKTGAETKNGLMYFVDGSIGFHTGGSVRGGTGSVTGFFTTTKYSSITLAAMVSSRYNVGMVWLEAAIDASDNVSIINSKYIGTSQSPSAVELVVITTTDNKVRLGLRITGSNVGANINIIGVYANAGRVQPVNRDYVTLTAADIVGIDGVFIA